MRTFFSEGDLLVAEVQAFFQDGSISLHTRSLKYGKLRNGQLVRCPSALIPRLKSHFITLPSGVELIIGLNGFVWVSAASSKSVQTTDSDPSVAAEGIYSSLNDDIPPEKREAVARVVQCVDALAEQGVLLTEARIAASWEARLEGEREEEPWHVKDLARGGRGRLEVVTKILV